MFVLDSSGSITRFNFYNYVIEHVNQVVMRLTLGGDAYQTGVISFGNGATLNIGLDRTYSAEEFRRLAAAIPFKDQNTNTSGQCCCVVTLLFC